MVRTLRFPCDSRQAKRCPIRHPMLGEMNGREEAVLSL